MKLKLVNLFRHVFVGVAGRSATTRGRFGLKSRVGMVSVILASLALTACDDSGHSAAGGGSSNGSIGDSSGGGTTTTYSIGGTVSGLGGTGLVLQDNGGDNLNVNNSGAFTFATKVNSGGTYAVTVAIPPSGQTCAVANGRGTATANVTTVVVSCTSVAAPTVTVGGTVSGLTGGGLVLQDNNGDDLPVVSNGSFVFGTALGSTATYSVTVKTQPTSPAQGCTVTNGSGTAAGVNITSVTVTCLDMGKFAYTANNQSNSVSQWRIDPASGNLIPVGANIMIGNSPDAVSLAPNGKWAFIATNNGLKIYAFSIDPNTGALVAVPGSPFNNGQFVSGHPNPDIGVDPSSHYLYLASLNDGTVGGFAIDQTTGALTALPGAPYAAGPGAGAIPAFSPNGKFLYVMNQTANTVSAYAINSDGSLSNVTGSPFATGVTTPTWISFTPNGSFAYVSGSGSNNIAAFTTDANTGALTPIASGIYATNDSYPADITIDSAGKHLYVPNKHGTTIAAFTINANGTLTSVGSAATGGGTTFLQIEVNGKYAYASASRATTNGLYGYRIDATTGALTALTGSPYATGSQPLFVTVDPSGNYAYTANYGSANVSGFKINPATGVPASLGNFAAGTAPFVVSISPEAAGVRD
ncbi:MAG TPA: beta-propeller fold lactonase family protein [Steroidobacteraceae bacterium]